jgi:hypothetical protein
MPATDPAERRRILHGAIECAIGLNPAIRNGQTTALTAAVWRIIEPALTQRDNQVTAVRALHVRNANTGTCEHCSERDYPDYSVGYPCPTIRALELKRLLAEPEAEPPLTWCAASMPGVGGEPLGPCVLRAGHDGPVHQASTGARWWPTDGATDLD